MAKVHPGTHTPFYHQDFDRNAPRPGRGFAHLRCWGCGELGNFRRDCRQNHEQEESESTLLELIQVRDEEIEELKSLLTAKTTELASSQTKNKKMSLLMKKLKVDLEECKKEVRDKGEEMVNKWRCLNKEFVETKHELNKKIKELEVANESEMTKMKLEKKEWKKAAEDMAFAIVGNEEICSKSSQLESLALCFNKRAAKRMSVGKMRKALDDCRMATRLNPGFLKAFQAAGNYHLILGEIDDAHYNYKKCLDSAMVCLDRRLTIEACDGLQKAERVVNCINQSTKLLQKKTFVSATNAMEVVTEALSISCYSEKLLELKGEALFLLHKYGEVVQLCEQTLVFAEKNCADIADEDQTRSLKIWRWRLMSRCYFLMAMFDLALVILEKYEQLPPCETKPEESSFPSAATIRELLRHKNAGNEAFQGGKYREAVSHYSYAIMQSTESHSFTAVCLCNRAAALQTLGEVTNAIADRNLAIALDRDYIKAITRRANLHEKIRDYEEAALDYQMVISLLEKQSEKKYMEDLAVARRSLSSMNTNMKKRTTLDFYLILGLKGSESGFEIKKAYHKAALKHHPDKAGKFLTRSESGADCHVWKEIHADANKLFKLIGQAYYVLSDPSKRSKYNLEESMGDDFER